MLTIRTKQEANTKEKSTLQLMIQIKKYLTDI